MKTWAGSDPLRLVALTLLSVGTVRTEGAKGTPRIGAAHQAEGGGVDLRVALFSTRTVHRLELAPDGAGAWTQDCVRCAHLPLRAPMRLTAPVDLQAGGPLRVTDLDTGEQRTATGLWQLRSPRAAEGVDVVLTVPSERYVSAVLSAEAAPDEAPAALRALAIVARTFALNGPHYTAAPGHLAAELCDSTACQASRWAPVAPAVREATRGTAGETLWFGPRRAQVFFSQHCGGTTEEASALWPKLAGLPYLQSHPDPYCLRNGAANWQTTISGEELHTLASAQGWHLPAHFQAVLIPLRSGSGRALVLELRGSSGEHAMLAASSLRLAAGRSLGWNRLRSDLYTVSVQEGSLVFAGRGHGHGVGLCQAGASEMARLGKDAGQILDFSFPGTHVGVAAVDHGWQTTKAGAVTVRSTKPLSAEVQHTIAAAWGQAVERWPPRQASAPELILAPTTELFRQLTGEPGWELASTAGGETVLQPVALRPGTPGALGDLLRHELLHQLVETEATAAAPLWLREGLVEVLAGEASPSHPVQGPLGQTEQSLWHPATAVESRAAHRAAASHVAALIAHYGLGSVRGWLRTGMPSGVG